MHINAFDYTLPKELIADKSAEPRDSARMLVLNRDHQTTDHRHVSDLAEYVREGDLVILNNTKVFKARLHVEHKGKDVEIFFLRPDEANPETWHCLLKPAKLFKPGEAIHLPDGSECVLMTKNEESVHLLDTRRPSEDMFELLDAHGDVPTPPYVRPNAENKMGYQTIYAEKTGSVAAPTAGFHLTERLMDNCRKRGARFANVTLHVGLGTFRPIRAEELSEHDMHEEWMHVPKDTIDLIKKTKASGGRVIAIGTTAVRALESLTIDRDVADIPEKDIEGFTRLFITPGFPFKIIDGLLTNFHLPKSTLLVLVSAFAGRAFVLDAYETAVEEKYRFYSFGDAMLII